MSVLDETVAGSFAGVPFLVLSSSIAGGRKDVITNFPNSDKQLVEDLGLKTRSYSLQAVISADPGGVNYIQKRDNLLRVLENGVTDILVHPLYGQINNIKARSYTLSENFTELGAARFSINFEVNDTNGIPIVSGDTVSKINTVTALAITAITLDISENYGVSNNFPSNFDVASDKIQGMVDAFRDSTSFLQVAADKVNEFSAQLGQMEQQVTSLVTQPQNLVDSVQGLFDTVEGLYVSVEATFQVMIGFFGFGDNDVEIIPTTASKVERLNNNNLLNSLIQAQALVLNYKNASNITYSTVSGVDRVSDILEQQYQDLLFPTADSTDSGLQSSTLGAITDVRTEVQSFFDSEKLSASRIISIRTVESPSRVLAYQYYGSQELGTDISDLNEDLNVTFLKKDLEIFTS